MMRNLSGITEEIIETVLLKNTCYTAWTMPVMSLHERERTFFANYFPAARTAIVLGRHISAVSEWKWYVRDDGSSHCEADDHAKMMCEQIAHDLAKHGFRTVILPYPEECGLQFRSVAQAAGAGEIGTSAFLLHPSWGPWIHLRVLATTAPTRASSTPSEPVCTRCNACVANCPAEAIKEHTFDGLRCREFRRERGEYIPSGTERELRYCTTCADVCPIGERPGK